MVGIEPPESATQKAPRAPIAASAAATISSVARAASAAVEPKTSCVRAPCDGASPGTASVAICAASAASVAPGAGVLAAAAAAAGAGVGAVEPPSSAASASRSAKARRCATSGKLSETKTGRPRRRDSRCASDCEPTSDDEPRRVVPAAGCLVAGSATAKADMAPSAPPIQR